jgi:hypothetical protein
MGQKMVCFGQLRPTRSRQDESKEVHEVGSKRPSLGCNGVHVLSLYPLIWRSLSSPMMPSAVALTARSAGRSTFCEGHTPLSIRCRVVRG